MPAVALGLVGNKFATLFFSLFLSFKNLDLTPREAFAVIYHYEARTGETTDSFKNDFEEFGKKLQASDFDLHDEASVLTLLKFPA